MMSETELSLAGLLDLKSGASQLDCGPMLNGLGQLSQTLLKGGLGKAVTQGLSQALNIDLGALLSESWTTLDNVRAALAATKGDPEAVAAVPLATHRISSRHAPTVSLILAGQPAIDLPFTVDCVLKIDSAELMIRNGAIVHLASGALSAQATIRFADKTVLDRSSPRIDLPGRLRFKAAAAPPDEAAA
jgi:hypothetical protein